MRRILSGNEAIARGAWEAGVHLGAAYPGTPSTEILEELSRFPKVYCEWSTNEKVALDVAAGAAYAGYRALATMKHVGLNVAADSFFYASFTGAEAGLVVVSADDPAMHSSQNEQDNRRFAQFARVPCLDPSDSQECKDFTILGFELSERFDSPILLRTTTRINHSATPVELGERAEVAPKHVKFPRNPEKYVMVPGHARKRHPIVEQRTLDVAAWAETASINRIEWRDRKVGIITAGVAYQYAREVFPTASVLKLGMVFPTPAQLIRTFADGVERLVVMEELDPVLEEQVRLLGLACEGKSIFPICGELDPTLVRRVGAAAGLPVDHAPVEIPAIDKPELPARPPVLCAGCPHRAVFQLLSKKRVPVAGDIGCYSLGLLPPLAAIHTTGCMGAGIGVAHGAARAGIGERMVAVIGDSTFYHSGMAALANVAYNRSNVLTIILDNRTTAMTGHQPNPGTGVTLEQQPSDVIDIEPLVRSLGIKHAMTVDGYDVEGIEKAYIELMSHNEPAVLIARRPCVLLPEIRKQWVPLYVIADKCTGCGICFRIGCPAILKSTEMASGTQKPKALIDPSLCTGCEVCSQVCPFDAIPNRDQVRLAEEESHQSCSEPASERS
ncbi:MAG: indolepyruvate ferredoxin oxidoreductase subunit alpha [Thermoanaerobaculaceae bacterium]|nr:indolepyruvate ferredoxin oxidoreductase subunit alpha [Thermoanaerobaculaceae bacterium]MDI9623044.1 indolepyruvate ferredoxin oxidoreductase subunit alpha [Acidobacteriota bacterium]NLH10469.1 indolepyruvate ferredoxin oxidoreductase subunit alpha [Holophagae bacterium]HPW56784.1 indolepyruvate ferredoxin oxidoreductase subunit alpha [Thermoanaerobaculaceae bacterium]